MFFEKNNIRGFLDESADFFRATNLSSAFDWHAILKDEPKRTGENDH